MVSAADPDACTQLMDLPFVILTSILHHVPLRDRLRVCTLVCRSFQAAAVAATNSISTSYMSTAQGDQLLEWLQRHGLGLTALEWHFRYGRAPSLASLPCPLLSELNLHGLSLQPGFFGTCTGLTKLLLKSCCMADSSHATSGADNPLTQLSVLSSLQHLGLAALEFRRSVTRLGDHLEFSSSLLSQLMQLTYLQLGSGQMQSDAALQHLSAVTALQHLDLNFRDCMGQCPTAAALTGLQHLQHLTALRLCRAPWAIDLHSLPALTVLTALCVLQLKHCTSVDPAVLAGFSQLQELQLVCKEAWDAEGSAALLAAIGRQPQLKRLVLCPYRIWHPPSPAAYSVLTASSSLQHLALPSGQLPAGAWQQMFPPGRCLPELRHLFLPAEDNGGGRQQLSPADMQAMVACCPALACLSLGPQLAVSTAAPLQQLTGLTILRMHASFQDCAPSIARLTGLQELSLGAEEAGDRVTVSGLLQLTVLQQLWQMSVTGAVCDSGLATSEANPDRLIFFNKVRMSAQQPQAVDCIMQLPGQQGGVTLLPTSLHPSTSPVSAVLACVV